MAFDLSTAKPIQKTSGFDLSTAKPIEAQATPMSRQQQRRRAIESRSERASAQGQARMEQLTQGLSPDVIEAARQKSVVNKRTGPEVNQQKFERALQLEQIRLENPYQAQLIEETGGLEAFLIGAGRDMTTIGRGVARPFTNLTEEEKALRELEKQEFEKLATQKPSAVAGQIVGGSAPFLPFGGVTNIGRTAAQRALLTGGLGAAEAATLASGEGATGEEISKAAAIGGTIGGTLGLVPAPSGGVSSKVDDVTNRGRQLLKEPSKREIAKGVAEAAPTPEQLRKASKEIYDSVSEAGIVLSPQSVKGFVKNTTDEALDVGLDLPPAGRSLTPESRTVIDRLQALPDNASVDDLEKLRRSAQNAASVASRAGNNADAAVNGSIVDNIDDYLSSISSKDFISDGVAPENVGKELATARKLYGKARKSELLDEAMENARTQASGVENGIRRQFDRIIKNKKQSRFFTKDELEAMRSVVEGTKGSNFFRKLSRLGFGKGQQHNVLTGSLSSAAGAASLSTMLGPYGAAIGAVLLPTAGRISASLAENLTRKNAQLANRIIRAGTDADKIAAAYLRTVPKAEQSVEDLTQLLLRPDINLDKLSTSPLAQEAIKEAGRIRQSIAAGAGAVAAPLAAEEEVE